MKNIILCLSLFSLLVSCKKNEKEAKSDPNQEITKKVEQLYSTYGKSNEALYTGHTDDKLFSLPLQNELQATVASINTYDKKLKKDEKPLSADHNFFTPLPDGYSNYKIKNITVSPSGKMADAAIEFEISSSNPKLVWKDKVQLIKDDQDEWKIDNIIFDKQISSENLMDGLKHSKKYADSLNSAH